MKLFIGPIGLFAGFAALAGAQQDNTTNILTNYARILEQHPCQTYFSEDLYGFGVRLGYYFNWVSGWIANNYVLDEIAGAQDTNSVFLLGVLASLLRGTYTHALKRIDGVILIQMAIGTLWSVLSLWGYRTCVYRRKEVHGIALFGGFGTHFRLLLSTLLAIYALWFFAVGVKADSPHNLLISDNPQFCNRVNVIGMSLSGGARYLGIVLSLLSLIYCAILLITSSLGGITRGWKIVSLLRRKQYASSSRLRYISGFSPEYLKILSLSLTAFNGLWIIFIITTIEMTIRENNIRAVRFFSDVNILTPAQLLPFIIGLASLCRMTYYAYEHFRSDQGNINPSLGLEKSIIAGTSTDRPTRRDHRIKWTFKLLSASFQDPPAPDDSDEPENQDVLNVREGWTRWQKAINTVLPWMSLLSFWPWDQSVRARRIEGFRDQDILDQVASEEAAKGISSATDVSVQKPSK